MGGGLIVYCIDQNTIMYTCVDELKQILLQNNSFVGIPYHYEIVGDEKDKQVNYIDSLYNTFGRKYDNKTVDSNLFCYVNSEQYRSYFKNMFELDYITFETFLGKEYLLSTILTLIYNHDVECCEFVYVLFYLNLDLLLLI